MNQNKNTPIKSAYNFRVFDTATGKTITLCTSKTEADTELARWKRRCERKGVEFSAVVIDETPEQEPAK